MTPPQYRGYRFPADVIQRAFWMWFLIDPDGNRVEAVCHR
jgi:hypothetical protein